jgi:hypothetical protein
VTGTLIDEYVKSLAPAQYDPGRPDQPDAWRALARDFTEEKAKIDEGAPGTSDRSFHAARLKIDAGDFQHD